MNNRVIDIISDGEKALTLALELIWPNAKSGQVTHYKLVHLAEKTDYYLTESDIGKPHVTKLVEDPSGKITLILFEREERGSIVLPYPHDFKQTVNFVTGWLRIADYGPQPDHDGVNQKGWRVFNQQWGLIAGHNFAILAVQPKWAMYGK
jgi:hypothetical protein